MEVTNDGSNDWHDGGRLVQFARDAVPELVGGDVDDSRVRELEFCAEGGLGRTGARVGFRTVMRGRGGRGIREST